MKETFLKYMFSELYRYSNKHSDSDFESILKDLGYDMGKKMLILRGEGIESNLEVLLYKIAFNIMPSFYETERILQRSISDNKNIINTDVTNKNNTNTNSTNNMNTNKNSINGVGNNIITYLLIESQPLMNKYISLPDEYSSFTSDAIFAGSIEAFLQASGFKSNVTAHNTGSEQYPDEIVYVINIENK